MTVRRVSLRWLVIASSLLLFACGDDDTAGNQAPSKQDAGTDVRDSSVADSHESEEASPDVIQDSGFYSGCEAMCQQMTAVGCPNPPVGCLEGCQSLVDYAPWCESDSKAYVDCAAEVPPSAWSCDANGNAVLGDSSCKSKQLEALTCASQGPSSGLPDLSAECATSCKHTSGLACQTANCESECVKVITNGFGEQGVCKGAFAAATKCAADRLSSSDYDCGADGGKMRVLSHACDLQAQAVLGCVAQYCKGNPSDPACQSGSGSDGGVDSGSDAGSDAGVDSSSDASSDS